MNKIVKVVKSRLEVLGMSQALFAEFIGTSPAQMGNFLKRRGSLSLESLEKGFDLLGLDLSLYEKRMSLAEEVAEILLSKNVLSLDNWSKEDLASLTKIEDIKLFFDVDSEEEYLKLKESGVIDVESTFPYFKALVSYYMALNGEKPTASEAKFALTTLFEDTDCHVESKEDTGEEQDLLDYIAEGAEVVFDSVREIINGYIEKGINKQIGALPLFSSSKKGSLFSKALDFFKN